MPHTTRFLSCDGFDRILYESTGHRRVSWHLPLIGTLAINHFTLPNLSDIFEHVQSATKACNTLRLLDCD